MTAVKKLLYTNMVVWGMLFGRYSLSENEVMLFTTFIFMLLPLAYMWIWEE
jgi:hypothetical protein